MYTWEQDYFLILNCIEVFKNFYTVQKEKKLNNVYLGTRLFFNSELYRSF